MTFRGAMIALLLAALVVGEFEVDVRINMGKDIAFRTEFFKVNIIFCDI